MLLAAALLLLVPICVDAQPAVVTHGGGRGTLGVGVVADIDGTWGSATPSKKAGIYLTAAIDVLPHVRVRLDVDVPAWAYSLTIIEFATFRSVESREQRMVTLSPLVELHGQVSERVRFSALVGIASGWRQSRVRFETDSIGPGGVWERQQANYSDSRSAIWGTFGIGTEVAVALTTHVAVVPGVRMLWLPFNDFGSTIVRPGLAVRWYF